MFTIDTETDVAQDFLYGIAESIIDEKQPGITVTIYTKYYPPTRLDPPEWDDEERDVEYGSLPDSVQEDLQDRVIEALSETLDETVFDSENDCKSYILSNFTDKDWERIVNSWSESNYDTVQERAQEDFNNRTPDWDD